MISEYEAVKKILDANGITDIDEVEYGSECFDELMDYYADEMPYGVMKARTGMPDEWIYDKLCDLGFDKEEQNDPNGLPLNFTDRYHDEEPA
jgi:hypothetical protein